jgi:uncharacterized membrane protein YccC
MSLTLASPVPPPRPQALRAWLLPPPIVPYVLRVLLAVALALYAAYALQLEAPSSAATTVLIVANASRGAVISKSVWRVVGSLLGAVAAVVLFAAFAQAPVLFVFGLALWIGACTAVSSAFRYNRGYAAVLAGYTVTLVAFGAITDPDRIFDLAIGRVAVVSVGVISAGLVFMLTDTGEGAAPLESGLLRLIAGTCAVIAQAFESPTLAAPRTARSALAADLLALDQLVEFASAEDAGLSRYAGDLRIASAQLFSALTGGLRCAQLLRALPAPTDQAAAAAMEQTLRWIAAPAPAARAATIAARLAETRALLHAAATQTGDLGALSAFDQSLTLIGQLEEATASLAALQTRAPRRPQIRLRGYVNWSTALRNGGRAAIAVSLAGLFWIVSQWPNGAATLTLIGPLCALLAQNDSASAASIAFAKGVALAALGAFVCNYALLPMTDGYPLLLAAMAPFLIAGLLAAAQPRYTGMATGFLIFFFGLLSPANPMVFDLAASLNGYFASIIGALCVVLAFRVILPPDPIAEAAVIARSLRRAVLQIRSPQPFVFEHLQHQKLLRLSRRLADLPALRFPAVGEATAAMLIVRQLQTLHRATANPAIPAAARTEASRVLIASSKLLRAPHTVAEAAAAAATTVLDLTGETPTRRLAAAMQELASLISFDTDFLQSGGILAALRRA